MKSVFKIDDPFTTERPECDLYTGATESQYVRADEILKAVKSDLELENDDA